jgi:hypothetical protein
VRQTVAQFDRRSDSQQQYNKHAKQTRKTPKRTRLSVNITRTHRLGTNRRTGRSVKAIVLKAVAGGELKVARRTGVIFVALAVHEIGRPHRITMDNHVGRHVFQGLLTVTTHTVRPAIEVAGERSTKFAVLAPRAFQTSTGLAGKIHRVREVARAALDAKDRIGRALAIVLRFDGHFARGSNVARFEGNVDGGHAIANELVIAVLILSFNAEAAVSVRARACVCVCCNEW